MATSTEKKFKVGDKIRILDVGGHTACSLVPGAVLEVERVPSGGAFWFREGKVCSLDEDIGAGPVKYEIVTDKPAPKFKVGDFVRCIATTHTGLKTGAVYKVADVRSDNVYFDGVYIPNHGWFDAHRFERADPKPAETPSKYETAALEIAKLVTAKQIAYGDSFGKSGEVFRILYPNGIAPEQMDDALVMVRLVDKMFRIANKKDAFGESPWGDSNGYTLLALVRDLEARATK